MKKFLIFFILLSLFAGTIIGIALTSENIVFDDFGLITLISLILFIAVLILSSLKLEYYIISLVFVLFGFPSNVNNIFPGVPLGNFSDLGVSSFPVFTHIEVFLIFGIIRYYNFQLKLSTFDSKSIVFISLLTVSYIVNFLGNNDTLEYGLLVVGSYQIRILLLLFFILSFDLKSINIQKAIISGLKLSVIFLFIESLIFTFINGKSSLTSGSLGVNTFGNILAAVGLYFLVMRLNSEKKDRIHYFWIILPMLMSIGTGTRMSIIAFLFGLIIYKYPVLDVKFKNIIIISFSILLYYFIAPEKYNIFYLINYELINYVFNDFNPSGLSEFRTEDNSSLITRLLLFRTSINMIIENFIFGIGAGKWNYLKPEYGFFIPVLIDSHNGYLSALSQYGLIAGGVFIWFLLLKPVVYFTKYAKVENLYLLGSISSVMLIAEFSNSGLFKIQVFSLLSFIAILLHLSSRQFK